MCAVVVSFDHLQHLLGLTVGLMRPLEDIVVRPVKVVTRQEPRETIRELIDALWSITAKVGHFGPNKPLLASRSCASGTADSFCIHYWLGIYSSVQFIPPSTNIHQQYQFISTWKHGNRVFRDKNVLRYRLNNEATTYIKSNGPIFDISSLQPLNWFEFSLFLCCLWKKTDPDAQRLCSTSDCLHRWKTTQLWDARNICIYIYITLRNNPDPAIQNHPCPSLWIII